MPIKNDEKPHFDGAFSFQLRLFNEKSPTQNTQTDCSLDSKHGWTTNEITKYLLMNHVVLFFLWVVIHKFSVSVFFGYLLVLSIRLFHQPSGKVERVMSFDLPNRYPDSK